jgi:hypothetical protein
MVTSGRYSIRATKRILHSVDRVLGFFTSPLYQERGVFGKIKMDPAKRAQTQSAGEV